MGYYTYYYLDIVDTKDYKEISKEILKDMGTWLANNSDWFEPSEANDITEMIEYDSMKWYDSDKDMLELSKLYPDYGFILEGIGEEYNDRWCCYYKNGAMQMEECQFIYGDCQLW